ncbi:maleate cis-trans isomerase [Streptomyces sp. CC53]|uniref:maleate cis-trans isomerase family protein n=1 Tax=Streptomyces sp. CC53 TaxID=1906740 RepID=UPI0008DE54BD|nr:maleate cis-trans isomerase [Streptomyces sp. CC53]OII59566.1 maleate cis-trans isomerase [Streptomyces sp. CC53]
MTHTTSPTDGWDASVRIGVVVPHADIGPEAELQAMAPASVSIHGSRIHFAAMRAGGEMDNKIPHDPVRSFVEPPHLDQAVELLAASPLHALTLGFTSSSYLLKATGEQELYQRLQPATRGLPITGTTKAARAALNALGAHKIAVINPPWFDDTLSTHGADYFREFGFQVVHHGPCPLPSHQKAITPDNLSAWIRTTITTHHPDAVLIAGNGIRAVGTIKPLETELGCHIITANQANLWHTLHLAGATDTALTINNYGHLFTTTPKSEDT